MKANIYDDVVGTSWSAGKERRGIIVLVVLVLTHR